MLAVAEVTETQDPPEQALGSGDLHLREMLDAMPDCVKIFDRNAQLIYINPKGLELLEATSLEALAASGHSPVPPRYMAECLDVHNRVLSGETVVWSYELVGMQGARHRVEAHAVPFRTSDGAPAQLSITRDITERRVAEETLRRNEERLRLIQEASGLADFEIGENGVATCSDLFFEQVGLPVGDKTITLSEWRAMLHPDDREKVGKQLAAALEYKDTFEAEYRITRCDDGDERWIYCLIKFLRGEQGDTLRTVGAHTDITERKKAELALKDSEQRMRLVQQATGLADFWAGADGVAHVSDSMVSQMGLPPGTQSLEFEELLNYVHPEDRESFDEQVGLSLQSHDICQWDFRIVHGVTGQTRWIRNQSKAEHDENGVAIRMIGAHFDITDRKCAEEEIRDSEERFRLAAEAAGLGVWSYDPINQTREWSERFIEIFGLSSTDEPFAARALDCLHPEDRKRFWKLLEDTRDSGTSINRKDTFRLIRPRDGDERWIFVNSWKNRGSGSRTERIILTVRDVTEEKTAEERIRWTANHDELTRLANRTHFQDELEKTLREGEQSGGSVGLLLIDLDHFKQINDSLGHDVGDSLLRMFAERLREVVPARGLVARLGGDEFAVIVPRLEGPDFLSALAESIHKRMRAPFLHKGRALDCRASIGCALFPEHSVKREDLMKNADMALYAAKAAGRATTATFEPALREEMQRHTNMIKLARDAIHDQRIFAYYQPKVDLRSRAIVGFEALLRWRTPDGEIRLPDTIDAAFENLDVAALLSDKMIELTISDMRTWLDDGIEFGHVAINASAAEFRRDDFAERVLDQLAQSNIPPSMLQLEVTEKVFLGRGAEYVHRALARLSAAGVGIALDDFGTGYASLRHLNQFPVDIIKIDQSFVRDMEFDPSDAAIIRAVINLARSLNISVVAEGIEKETQADRLLFQGCDFGQGFLFSEAQPPVVVPELIRHSINLSGIGQARPALSAHRQHATGL